MSGDTFLVLKFLFSKNNRSEKEYGLNILLLCPFLKMTCSLLNPLSSTENCQNSNTSNGFVSEGKLGQF